MPSALAANSESFTRVKPSGNTIVAAKNDNNSFWKSHEIVTLEGVPIATLTLLRKMAI